METSAFRDTHNDKLDFQWLLYELSVNQDLQQELREEVATLPDNSVASINSLSLLDAVLKETLRIHPPISENHHEVR